MSPRSEESRLTVRDQATPLPPARRGHAGRAQSRRTVLVAGVVGIPVSIALLLLSLRHVDGDALQGSLGGADPVALFAALVAMSLVYLTQAARWRVISLTPRLPVARFFEWVLAGIAINNVVPGRAGDLARVEWLSRGARVPRARALAAVAVDRGFDLVALVGLLALTYPVVDHTPWLKRLWLVGGAAGVLVGVLFVAAIAYARLGRVSPSGGIRRLLADLASQAGDGLRSWRGVQVAALSVVAWCIWALSAFLVASSLGIELTLLELFFVTAVLNLGVAIPSSPGFIGTYQWLGVSALGILGIAHAEAFAFSVLMHATWYVPTTLAGAAIALRKLPPVLAGIFPRRPSENHAA
jgi:uncharacterized membrane protein YbhN (UPF0104 family)